MYLQEESCDLSGQVITARAFNVEFDDESSYRNNLRVHYKEPIR